jgi:hypothetical protein
VQVESDLRTLARLQDKARIPCPRPLMECYCGKIGEIVDIDR